MVETAILPDRMWITPVVRMQILYLRRASACRRGSRTGNLLEPLGTATVCSNMAGSTIPQRELRNNIGEILRQAEAGTEFTITVRGRPIARLGPLDQPRIRRADLDSRTVLALLAETPVDDRFIADLQEIRQGEQPLGDPWQRR